MTPNSDSCPFLKMRCESNTNGVNLEISETSRLAVEKVPPNLKTEGVSIFKDEVGRREKQ